MLLKNDKDKLREKKLMEIMQYRFAVIETALYLDTHPNDGDVLERHNYYAEKAKLLTKEFEEKYNETLSVFATPQGYWTHIENWPFGNCGGKCNVDV